MWFLISGTILEVLLIVLVYLTLCETPCRHPTPHPALAFAITLIGAILAIIVLGLIAMRVLSRRAK